MNLYVREGDGVLTDYSNGMICVLAENLEEALKLIDKKMGYETDSFPKNNYKIIEKPEAFICRGGS